MTIQENPNSDYLKFERSGISEIEKCGKVRIRENGYWKMVFVELETEILNET